MQSMVFLCLKLAIMYTSVWAQSQRRYTDSTKQNVGSNGEGLLSFVISQMQSNIDGSLSCINIITNSTKEAFATGKIIFFQYPIGFTTS